MTDHSRLDEAITAIEQALESLSVAVEERLDQDARKLAEAQQAQEQGSSETSGSAIADDDLKAMKSELHEAMTLLKNIQDLPDASEG